MDDRINYSATGQIAHDFWTEVCAHFPQVDIPSFVIMPNHVHAMIVIHDSPPGAGDVVWKPRGFVGNPSDGTGGGTPPLPGHGDPWQGRGGVSTPRPDQQDPDPGRGVVSTPRPGLSVPGQGRGKPDLGHIVAFYKYQTTKRINAQRENPGCRFWQRNYFEHIIRNDEEYQQVIEYILTNPLRWESDQLHPAAPNPFNQD